MDGRNKVFYCVFTLLTLSKFTISVPNNGLNANVDEKVTYNGDQVLRVFTVNLEHMKKITELENRGLIQKWYANSTSVDIMVKKNNLEIVKNALNKGSLIFDVFIEDIQRAINEESTPLKEDESKLSGIQGHKLKFNRYYKINEIYEYIDNISREHPDLVEVETIGKTYEGVPLRVVRIKPDEQNAISIKSIWVDGGIHAREWISVSSVLYLINELVYNRSAMKPEMKNTEFHILPIVNPDGYKYSHESERLWRKNRRKGINCVGTDLNRNWDFYWNESNKYSEFSECPCYETYRGSKAFSELETEAVALYIMNNPSKFYGFVTFHCFGQYLFYPWSYTTQAVPDLEELDRVGQVMATAIKNATSKHYTVGNCANIIYSSSGSSMDWAKGVANIKYSYGIELSNGGFVLPPSKILPTGKEAYAAVSALAKEINKKK